LTVALSGTGAQIYGVLTRLTQAFSNLLNNALKDTAVGGEIHVKAHTSAGYVAISIHDNGAGISDDLMLKMFPIFEQGPTTMDRTKGGLGIGLALMKNIVKSHGGVVSAGSEGPGMEATFTVTLPLATRAQLASSKPYPLHPQAMDTVRPGMKVLLFDDNANDLYSTEAFPHKLRFRVAIALESAQALNVAVQFKPHWRCSTSRCRGWTDTNWRRSCMPSLKTTASASLPLVDTVNPMMSNGHVRPASNGTSSSPSHSPD